ncbi:growth inhibitor PemK [Arthrobacter sp. Soil782]|uniref:type II toxin-antitoxin system PemK/MazF family toxin n=1 Tax=Arthrobacter sp. Soil782 TaxID=1736410 RepID=UPI0006FE705D|nr:type II toxin-antitoxin system PemK/MazF family toxin [Arthrobacter sp. Soil782]KRF05291.1 growth inhibitor PemK [Arthrobacter sp. Soil782]
MSRGDICVAAARGSYTGKPRPVVIVQDDRFDSTGSLTVCPLTTHWVEAPLIRIPVEATATTGISQRSQLMVDKIVTMPRDNVRETLGRLTDPDMVRLDRALLVFLGLAG